MQIASGCPVLDDLSPVLLRLQRRCSSFREVLFALDAPTATQDVKRLPALYLLQAEDRAGAQRTASGAHTQQVTTQFDVHLFMSAVGIGAPSSKQAKHAEDRLGVLKKEVVLALTGWTWLNTVSPIRYAAGKLMGLNSDVLVYRLKFETDAQLRVLATDVE